jgi:hypothetical protein
MVLSSILVAHLVKPFADYEKKAIVSGHMYKTEPRTFGGVTTTITYAPSDHELDAVWKQTWEIREILLSTHDAKYRIAVKTDYTEMWVKERLEPDRPNSPLVNKKTRLPRYSLVIIKAGDEEPAGLIFKDASDYGYTPAEMRTYLDLVYTIQQIRTHNTYLGDSAPVMRREIHWASLLESRRADLERRYVQHHITWLRRRHALAVFAAANRA